MRMGADDHLRARICKLVVINESKRNAVYVFNFRRAVKRTSLLSFPGEDAKISAPPRWKCAACGVHPIPPEIQRMVVTETDESDIVSNQKRGNLRRKRKNKIIWLPYLTTKRHRCIFCYRTL